ncbi:MAG: hypothetical protein FWH47_03075 [Methanomassiliicoccaceae archaeon]|nr:hypothetical protein [Methanomassiliicoccaceae archaeon]
MQLEDVLRRCGAMFLRERLPIINGVITKEGYLKMDIDLERCSMRLRASPLTEECLGEGNQSDISVSGSVVCKSHVVHHGEGSYGGEGFIAVTGEGDRLVWLMFHDEINPIERLEITDKGVIGVNNCGARYEFGIDWGGL